MRMPDGVRRHPGWVVKGLLARRGSEWLLAGLEAMDV